MIKLRSTDPFDKPLIDPHFLTTEFDIIAMRESVKATKRFVAAPAWADYVTSPFGRLSATTDADIDDYIREAASSVFHPVGTAAMSRSDSKFGVVDQDLLVKGADGLRIVDASVFVSFVKFKFHEQDLFCHIALHSECSYARPGISPCCQLKGHPILSRYGICRSSFSRPP